MEQKERVLRVAGGQQRAHRSYGVKAQDALENYWPLRDELLQHTANARQPPLCRPYTDAAFLNYSGRRLTQRSVGRIVKNTSASSM